jgi:aminopeptidase N
MLLCALLCMAIMSDQSLCDHRPNRVSDSGGPLTREQSAYDVLYYRLHVTFDTTTSSIASTMSLRALTLDTLSVIVLDLHSNFIVDSIVWHGTESAGSILPFERSPGKIRILLPAVVNIHDTVSLTVSYHGVPVITTNPPWTPGFVWKRTSTGEIWAGVACEREGADIWFPCKDHPSDEPDSVDLLFTVPENLQCISNGVLRSVTSNGIAKTFHWHVSVPINNYNVTFYLGPYQQVPVSYISVTGTAIPVEYWFLPQSLVLANQYASTFLKDLRFFEEVCGPFPFRNEKYGLVEAPYWGMEHQTAIAYGNNFLLNTYGFDYIHLHELAHEWWGNLVTARDWSDVWIHEGFATYMEALFVDRMLGAAHYTAYMLGLRQNIYNAYPVAPRLPSTTAAMFSNNDIYRKGAWILHTLRWHLGDSLFFDVIRKCAYPDPSMESVTDGSQCRLATTDDIMMIAEEHSGMDLDWFFEVYLRRATLPGLEYSISNSTLTLRWIVPDDLPFSLPVEVRIGSDTMTVAMKEGSGSIAVPSGMPIEIDPRRRILMLSPKILSVAGEITADKYGLSVYPNPFNPYTTIRYSLPEAQFVALSIFDLLGREVAVLSQGYQSAGEHTVQWNAARQSSGIYLCKIRSGQWYETRKVMLLK